MEYVHCKKVHTQGHSQLKTVQLQQPVTTGNYMKHMQDRDHLDQFIKYYSFPRKIRRSRKMLMYLLQVVSHDPYFLYLKYSTNSSKQLLCNPSYTLMLMNGLQCVCVCVCVCVWGGGGDTCPSCALYCTGHCSWQSSFYIPCC